MNIRDLVGDSPSSYVQKLFLSDVLAHACWRENSDALRLIILMIEDRNRLINQLVKKMSERPTMVIGSDGDQPDYRSDAKMLSDELIYCRCLASEALRSPRHSTCVWDTPTLLSALHEIVVHLGGAL